MAVGKEQSILLNVVISSGSGNANIAKQWDIARRLRVIPLAETNRYNVTIDDGDGDIIFFREDQIGTLSETVDLSLGIAANVAISVTTGADGTYKVKFDMH